MGTHACGQVAARGHLKVRRVLRQSIKREGTKATSVKGIRKTQDITVVGNAKGAEEE